MMSGTGSSSQDRNSVQARLGSLFTSESSPRSSLGDQSRPASPHKQPTKLQIDTGEELGRTMSRSSSLARQARQTPILRWFGASTSTATVPETSIHKRSPSDSAAMSSLRASNSLSVPAGRRSEEIPVRRNFTNPGEVDADLTNHTAELQQAISDEVFKIKKPPEARMASHHRTSSLHSRELRYPTLMDKSVRASRPTASITKPLAQIHASLSPQPSLATSPTSYSRPGLGLGMAASGLLRMGTSSNEPTARTSLDSLRSLSARDRGIQTSAAQAMSPVPSGMNRWWFQDGNKEAVDGMLHEEDKAPTAQQEVEGIRKKCEWWLGSIFSLANTFVDLRPRNPVVFCHGLLGFDSVTLGATFAPLQITHWRGIKEVLEENGVEVLITKVPATSRVDERAKVLEEKYPGRKVHLIGEFWRYRTNFVD
jgi:triacylglycerol lipase